MKIFKIIMSIALLFMLLFVVSCEEKQQTVSESRDSERVKNDIEINIDKNAIPSVSTVSVYHAQYWDSTQYDLETPLVKGTVVGYNSYAEGPQTAADYNGMNEYLNRFDGGLSFFGKKGSSIDGGFSYLLEGAWDGIGEYANRKLQWDRPEYLDNRFYGCEDLAFASLEQAESELMEMFQSWDLSMQVLEHYTLDLDGQQEQLDYYRTNCKWVNVSELVQPYQEGYLILMAETVDGIPLMPYAFTSGDTMFSDWMTGNLTSVYVTETGIVNMLCYEAVAVDEKLEDIDLVPFDTVLTQLVNNLEEDPVAEGTAIQDAGLYYIGMPDEDSNGFILTPCWFFCLTKSSSSYGTEEVDEGTEVSYEAFNAVTGEWIQR